MAGIADVARAAGVSKSTACRALTGSRLRLGRRRATRVRDAAAALGYVPTTSAVSLVTGRTQTVGVVMPSLDRWFFAQVLEGIQDALLERRYDLALYGAPPESAARREMFEHFLARKRFDGLIAVGHRAERPRARAAGRLRQARRERRRLRRSARTRSSIDDEAAARIATEHLIGLGHREIVVPRRRPRRAPHELRRRRRLDGYRAACATRASRHPLVTSSPR